jgi:hypothetical protein
MLVGEMRGVVWSLSVTLRPAQDWETIENIYIYIYKRGEGKQEGM